MFIQVDYAIQDLKNGQVTTDLYIDEFFQIRIVKLFNKMMQRVYEDSSCESDLRKSIVLRRIEEEQQKEIYFKMIIDDSRK